MAVRFKYRGLEIEADSRADVDSFLDEGQSKKATPPPERIRTVDPLTITPERLTKAEQARGLLESLSGLQLDFVRAILEQPLSDTELRGKLGLESNKALAGVRSAISKRAKAAGISKLIEVEETMVKGDHGKKTRAYRYKAGKLLLEALAS